MPAGPAAPLRLSTTASSTSANRPRCRRIHALRRAAIAAEYYISCSHLGDAREPSYTPQRRITTASSGSDSSTTHPLMSHLMSHLTEEPSISDELSIHLTNHRMSSSIHLTNHRMSSPSI